MRCAFLVVAVALALTGCSSAPSAETPAPVPVQTSSPAAAPLRVAVVGDSITDVQSRDFPSGDIDPASWVSRILDDRHVFTGGWAVWGATTAQMRAGVSPLDPDILVILAGTNDVGQGIPFEQSAANIAAIALRVGGKRVLVSAIPPYDPKPEEALAYNRRLRDFVRAQHWEWVGPPAALQSNDRFRPGMTDDGVHPSAAGAAALGNAIREVIRKSDRLPARTSN